MSQLEQQLARWRQAGLLDADTAAQIRAFEASRPSAAGSWLARLALGAGGLMAAAGLLLFVAANWDGLSPPGRGVLLLGTLTLLHVAAGAASERLPHLATTLHAVGTATLGAVIFLLGQTYNLHASWAHGFLLWALGGWAGWLLLRQWPQLLFAAVLTPVWVMAEWVDRYPLVEPVAPAGALALTAIAYLVAERGSDATVARRTIAIVGAVTVLPLAAMLFAMGWNRRVGMPPSGTSAGLALALFALPLVGGTLLRPRGVWHMAVAALWVGLLTFGGDRPALFNHFWAALGGVLLALSGVLDASPRRISVGFAGFALAVLAFYFGSVMDRFGRATSLLVGGVSFLVLGALLERLRRRLVARATEQAA